MKNKLNKQMKEKVFFRGQTSKSGMFGISGSLGQTRYGFEL